MKDEPLHLAVFFASPSRCVSRDAPALRRCDLLLSWCAPSYLHSTCNRNLQPDRLTVNPDFENEPVNICRLDMCLSQELGLSREQFIDLCILMGCDYCGTIRGIGAPPRVSVFCIALNVAQCCWQLRFACRR